MTAPRALTLSLLLVLACDPPSDLGKICTLHGGADGGVYTTVSSSDDFYDNGTPACENLVCLRPAGSPLDAGFGFCSSPCSPKNPSDPNSSSDDCAGGTMPLVCRAASLDPKFLASLPPALLEQYLGGSTAQTLCTTPQ